MPDTRSADEFTVLFAGGGTGGHLMPGLSVAEDLRKRCPHARCVFAGSSGELEKKMVDRRGFDFRSLPSVRWAGSWDAPQWVMRMASGLVEARRIIQQLRPHLVVSLGGHAALLPSLAGLLCNVPLAVMEQNALPGKTNRLLSWWAREIYVPWPGTEMSFAHPERVHVTGNPVRNELGRRKTRRLAVRFGLSPRKRTLLVMGGSQGAQFINLAIIEALPQLEREAAWLQILHSTGRSGFEDVREAYGKTRLETAVFPFIEDMSSAYALCDLALCRAGGTTLAELTALGVPAVLVPLPSAANDHQRLNASVLARDGAAVAVEQSDLTGGRLAKVLLTLLRNEPCLATMRAASYRLGRPSATLKVVRNLVGLSRGRRMTSTDRPIAIPALRRG